jgi:hypothetical protein
MRRTRRFLAGLAVVAGLGASADEAPVAFVTGIDDLPLMPGLVEATEAGMAFDAPSGRIVEAYAGGAVSRDAVLRFYAATLPQLGWQRTAAGSFRREGETLNLEFPEGDATRLTVRFTLSPGTEKHR